MLDSWYIIIDCKLCTTEKYNCPILKMCWQNIPEESVNMILLDILHKR